MEKPKIEKIPTYDYTAARFRQPGILAAGNRSMPLDPWGLRPAAGLPQTRGGVSRKFSLSVARSTVALITAGTVERVSMICFSR